MHPPRSLVIGFACFFGGSTGCISAQSLRRAVTEATAEQGSIVEGINGLDAVCQSLAKSNDELARCRVPRDQARAGLRRQLTALGEVAR